jgi:23S rRNA C2498 (ribose-2'-O)-methylase RlmM
MNKEEAIEWTNHFATNENLWFAVIKFNDGYVVYDSNHFKRYPSLINKIIYTTKKI